LDLYEKSVDYANDVEEVKEAENIKNVSKLNLAMCQIKLKDFAGAAKNA